MTIEKICTRDVALADPEDSAQAAGQKMLARNVGSLVVIDGSGHPIGILTDRDLAVRCVGEGRDPKTTCVGDLMSASVQTALPVHSITNALATMQEERVRRLVVVDRDRRVRGILSIDDLLQHMIEDLDRTRELLVETSLQSAAD